MKIRVRQVLAVLAGAAAWAALWIPTTLAMEAAFPTLIDPERYLDDPRVLVTYIVLGAVGLSLLAGWVTAAVARPHAMPAVWALAALQLALGIAAEVAYWELLPLWYHLVFLGLLVPMTVAGGRLRDGREAGARRHRGWRASPGHP